MKQLLVIGRKDKADFPALGLHALDVKIDSGAYSCSIHCEYIEEVEIDGVKKLEVTFLDQAHPKFTGKKHYFDTYKQKKVKSSTGDQQERFFVSLQLVLFDEVFQTEFSLTRRNGLRNPVLLGRKLLNNHFLIDTSKSNLSHKWMKSKLKKQ